jgi:hypothetical protein
MQPAAPQTKSRVIAVIENCPILLQPDGSVLFVAKAAIDGDGTGSAHGDPDFQPRTSLKPYLNSDTENYIVVPPAIPEAVGPIVLGCQARVKNRINNLVAFAVVGDIGPKTKIGEISIALADALGIASSPTKGGETTHVIEYTLWPGLPSTANGKTYTLQPFRP